MREIIRRTLLIFTLVCFFWSVCGQAEERALGCSVLGSLPAGVSAGFVVEELETGKRLIACNPDLLLKPASILKILPGIIALKTLGAEFRFKTRVYSSPVGGSIKQLAIQGGGDPSLTIESLWLLTRKLRLLGINQVAEITLDASRYDDPRGRVGQRAYQTGGGALSFNYNSIGFNVCPTRAGQLATVSTDPWEIPVELVGSVQTVSGLGASFSIDEVSAGAGSIQRFTLHGSIGADRSCEFIYRSVSDPIGYLERVLVELLKYSGIKLTGKIKVGHAPAGLTLLFEHNSKSLGQILQDLNQFSNNFIAEQILFYLGDLTQPALTRTEGLKALSHYADRLGFRNYHFEDGSGLDRDNRLPAGLITAALRDAAGDPNIASDFEQSLSVAGRSGTLKKRPLPSLVFRGKTGTLDGVSSVAGYLTTKSGRKLALTLIINGPITKEVAVTLEDRGILSLNR